MALAPGQNNLITDVPGLRVGNATDEKAGTGVTVLRCDQPFTAAVEIQGGGPGTRETDVLATENLVGHVDAITLSGGSVFGLAAADGVTQYLANENIGLRLSPKGPSIPIVSGAVLHDLGNDGDKDWGETSPYSALGVAAAKAADQHFALGSVGAGRGAMAGRLKGGLGSASIVLENGVTVGALAAVNPVGSVVLPDGETYYAQPFAIDNQLGPANPVTQADVSDPFPPYSRLSTEPQSARANTTLIIVATDAKLGRADMKRIAIMAHDGIARAVRPAHTPFDGDIVFAIATGNKEIAQEPPFGAMETAKIGACAADCVARAIARGAREAMVNDAS